MNMAQNNKLVLLKVALVLFIVITFVYGIGYLFFPQSLISMSGSEPVPSGWLRWPGGVLLSLTIGAILVFQKPEKQSAMIITFALGTLFTGLALVYNLFFSMVGSLSFTLIPTILLFVSSALLWWAWYKARDILK